MTQAAPRRKSGKQQDRAVATRNALLEAALREFGKRGYEGAGTRGICRRAKVASTQITHHFGTKEALWKAAASRVFEQYEARLSQRLRGLEGVDAATRLRLIIREYILFCAERPEFFSFMLEASRSGGERMAWLADEHLSRETVGQIELITEAQEKGIFVAGDPVHLRYLLIGAVNTIFAFDNDFTRVTGDDPFDEEVIERHIDLLLSVFMPGASEV